MAAAAASAGPPAAGAGPAPARPAARRPTCGCSLSQYSGELHCSQARMHQSEPGRPPSPLSCPSAASRSQGKRCHWPVAGCRYMKKFLVHLGAGRAGGRGVAACLARARQAAAPCWLPAGGHMPPTSAHRSMLLRIAWPAISLMSCGRNSASKTYLERGTGPLPARPWASACSSCQSSFSAAGAGGGGGGRCPSGAGQTGGLAALQGARGPAPPRTLLPVLLAPVELVLVQRQVPAQVAQLAAGRLEQRARGGQVAALRGAGETGG
jgi:hypothetical protein